MNLYQFSNYDIDQLEVYATEHWASLPELVQLSHALRRRNSPRAFRLNNRVKERIEELLRESVRSHLSSELRDFKFREWATTSGELVEIPTTVVVQGASSLVESVFNTILDAFGIQNMGALSKDADAMVIGREGWSEEVVDQQLDEWENTPRRVYSQEMFLAFLLTRKDPLQSDQGLLRFFSDDHPGLRYILSIGFDWPTTEAPLGSGDMDTPDSPETGVLKAMGYTVGRNGLSDGARRQILKEVYSTKSLPRIGDAIHMAEWGDPNLATRLLKMANTIAALARNAKRRTDGSMKVAVEDWESDLAWLQRTYYRGIYNFKWPETI